MATDSDRPSVTDGGTSAGEAAREVAEEASSTAKEFGRQAMDQARSTAGYVREQARTSVEQGKNQVAQQIGGLAKAFHRGSEELRSDEMGRLADQSEWLAGRVEELQRYLQERDATELLDDLRGVARGQPAWFLGGMFAAGLMTARFLHSSDTAGRPRSQELERGSGPGQSYQARDTTRL
jgi:hypothetical protein